MGVLKKFLFGDREDDMFSLELSGLSKKIKKYKRTGDEALLNNILDIVPSTVFLTYFVVPKEADKTEIGRPLVMTEGKKRYFPLFTKANHIMKVNPPEKEGFKYRIQNLYINYLLDLMDDDEEFKDVSGFFINPKSEESSIIINKATYTLDEVPEKKEKQEE